MSTLDHEIFADTKLFRPNHQGPVTSARHRRNRLVYVALCGVGLLPTLLGASAGWRTFGLGLLASLNFLLIWFGPYPRAVSYARC